MCSVKVSYLLLLSSKRNSVTPKEVAAIVSQREGGRPEEEQGDLSTRWQRCRRGRWEQVKRGWRKKGQNYRKQRGIAAIY